MFELVQRNHNRSLWLVCIMLGLLVAVGYTAAETTIPDSGPVGVVIGLTLGCILFLISYYSGSAVLLSSAGAREIAKEDAPQLYNVVEEMVIASGLGAQPKIYVIESRAANAFATGRDPGTSAVAVTEGLLTICKRDELQAVIAHEIAHIKNRDILFMTLLAVMAGAIALISEAVRRSWRSGSRISRSSSSRGGGQAGAIILVIGLVLIILGPIVARIVFFAASRTREYLADAGGAIFTRNPGALADALEKIVANIAGNALPVPEVAQGMLIVGPALFESHPPIERRIAILRKLAGVGKPSYKHYATAFHEVTGASPKFIPESALGEKPGVVAGPVGIAAQSAGYIAATAGQPGIYRREALDAVKKKAGYRVFLCSCGATIKVPPHFPKGQSIKCPGCRRSLDQCILIPLGRQ